MKTVIDWLIADLIQTELDVSDEMYEALVKHAMDYLRVGRLSWQQWSLLGAASRKAFVEAADSLRIQSVLKE